MRLLAIVLLFFYFFRPSTAAEIKSIPAKDGRTLITIIGEILPGDADAFKAAVKAANDAGKFVSNIRLNSIGGNLLDGVKLAETVQFAKISTNVGRDATCASACFLIFAAGATKYANYTARLGVHGASDKDGTETVRSGAATVSMARVAKDLGVPPAIIGRMVVTPPTEMVWLSPQELQSMGTTMVGKPEQIPRIEQSALPRQTAPSAPIDLQPEARASKPPSWNDFASRAVELSAEQNRGKAASVRSCQPELKTCFNAVMYVDSKGVTTFAKVTKDMNDNIVRREACTLNASSDIRKCIDWDNGTMRRDMKDGSGNWVKVADE